MSDKTLLNEGTIRRFMKLAEIEPLANPFIERLDEDVELALEQDEMEDEGEEDPMAAMDMGAPDEEAPEMDMDMEDPEMEDPEMDLDMEDPDMDVEGEEDPMETLADEIKQVVVDKLEDMIEDGTLEFMTGEDEEEVDLEDEGEDLEDAGAELEDEGEDLEDVGAELEDEGEPEELEESSGEYQWDAEGKGCVRASTGEAVSNHLCPPKTNEDRVVAEVARRVTKRILSSR